MEPGSARHRIATASTRRSGWLAFVLTTLARTTLAMFGGMLIWTLIPALLGWKSTVVMSGSMQPRIAVGDVVVSRTVPTDALTPGQILLVNSPDQAGRLRLHRFIRLDAHGDLILRGDANRQDDSTPVKKSAVDGVAALRIPLLGRPVIWAEQHQYAPLAGVLLLLLLVLRLATWYRSPESLENPEADFDEAITASGPRAPATPPTTFEPVNALLQTVELQKTG